MIEFSKFLPSLDYLTSLLEPARAKVLDLAELLKQQNKVTLTLGSVSLICLLVWLNTGKQKNVPPGPKGWPVVGILPAFVKALTKGTQTEFLHDIYLKHGPITTFTAGSMRFIWITDGSMIADLFKREEFATRPFQKLAVFRKITGGVEQGIFTSNGTINTEMRRFALLAFRDFGVGKKGLNEIVQTEATALTNYFEKEAEKNNGIVSNIKPKCQSATANVIHSVIFGFRNEYDDQKWATIVNKLLLFFSINPLSFPENFFPILRYLPFLNNMLSGKQMKTFLECEEYTRAYTNSQIEEHKSTYCEGEIRDFIDLYIKYERENREYYTPTNIFGTIMDLFRAGTDTTATTLSWSFMYLAKHQDIQKQVREEIDEVVGDAPYDRKVKDKLVKTTAFINELFRYVSVAGITPPHTVTQDVVVEGYTFPENSLIFGNLYSIHHDEKYWGDPQNFRIDRWIDDKGQPLYHADHFMPFSIGKRACPGKQIARIELMHFLVEMLQNFTFEVPEGYTDMSDQQAGGIIRAPKDFHVKITKRS